MKNTFYLAFALLWFCALHAQENPRMVTKNGGITVTFENEDVTLDSDIQDGLLEIIFEVYPKLMRDFNPQALQELQVKIDTSYTGVAYAHNGQVVISSTWLHQRPEDLDLMTHEVMHLIQAYPHNAGPGWLTEGIADYVRYVYGVNNEGAGWSLPGYASNQQYTDSYRVTARFLVWISKEYDPNFVVKLDQHLRKNTYSEVLWEKYTSKSLDELWDLYSKSPKIPSIKPV